MTARRYLAGILILLCCMIRCSSEDPRGLSVCGDGQVNEMELCDDGNWLSADGCRSDCQSTETCGNARLDYEAGEVCDGQPECRDCVELVGCGDGELSSAEICDDGNDAYFDGCGKDCQQELNFLIGCHPDDASCQSFGFGERATGCDLDDDGVIDNAFAEALGGFRSFLNTLIEPDIGTKLNFVLYLRGIAGGELKDQQDLLLGFMQAEDTDVDINNQLRGEGSVRILANQIDSDGLPLSRFALQLSDFRFSGQAERLSAEFPIQNELFGIDAVFQLALARAQLSGRFEGHKVLDGILCGAIPLEALFGANNPLAGSGIAQTLLKPPCDGGAVPALGDLMLGGATVLNSTVGPAQPDIDIDGDGLETFELNVGSDKEDCQPVISRCFDGDGSEVIAHDGESCVMDPKIADGFSLSLVFEAVAIEAFLGL